MNNEIEKANPANEKLWNKNYILLILANLFSAFSFNMVSTILSKYLVGLGATLTVAGIVVGIFSIMALVIRPVSGVVADRYSKRNILFASNLMIGISVLGYTVSDNVGVILCFRILHGIAFGMSGTASVSLCSEIIPKNRTGEGIGYVGLGQIVAVAVAPGLGIFTTNYLGYTLTFVCSCVLAVVSALLLLLFSRPRQGVPAGRQKLRRLSIKDLVAGEAMALSVISGVMSLNNGIVTAYILLFSEQLHIGSIGAYFLVTALFMFIVRPSAGRLMDRRGLQVLIYPAFAIGILGMLLHGLSTTLWMLLIAGALKAIASSAIQSSLLAECIKRAGDGRSGVASSTYYIGADIGQGVGPVIGGAIAGLMGYQVMFYFCAAVTLLGALGFYFFRMAERRKRAAGVSFGNIKENG